MNAVVSDASPLIVLAKAKLLRVLPALFSRVFVPQAVLDEIAAGPTDDPMKLALPASSWLEAVRLEPPISPLSIWQSGRGEAEVIEYARLLLPVCVRPACQGTGRRTGRRGQATVEPLNREPPL